MKKPRKNIKFKRVLLDQEKLKKWAVLVKKRDSFMCVSCGYSGYLHSHHIVSKTYVSKYAYEVNNGVTLCKSCHTGKRGVHGSAKPKNKLIELLRGIFKSKNYKEALSFVKDNKRLFAKNPRKPFYKKAYRKGFKRWSK